MCVASKQAKGAGISRDVSKMNKTPPGPTGGIIIIVEVYEAVEREPILGRWYLSFVTLNGRRIGDKE